MPTLQDSRALCTSNLVPPSGLSLKSNDSITSTTCLIHTRPKFGLPSQDLSTKSILPSEDADGSTDDSNEGSVPECDHRTVSTNTPLVHFASPPGSPKTCTEASDRFIRNELQKYISSRREKKITVASFLYNNARTRYHGIRCYKKNALQTGLLVPTSQNPCVNATLPPILKLSQALCVSIAPH